MDAQKLLPEAVAHLGSALRFFWQDLCSPLSNLVQIWRSRWRFLGLSLAGFHGKVLSRARARKAGFLWTKHQSSGYAVFLGSFLEPCTLAYHRRCSFAPRILHHCDLPNYLTPHTTRNHKFWEHYQSQPEGSQASDLCVWIRSCARSRYLPLFEWRNKMPHLQSA